MPDTTRDSAAEARHRRDAEFNDLWRRRDRLSEAEWKRLWEIVNEVLSNRWFTHYSALPGFFSENLIADFFSCKVFEPAREEEFQPYEEVHTGLLFTMYTNFLLDRIDAEGHVIVGPARGVDDPDEVLAILADTTEATEGSERRVLRDAGLTIEAVVESAKAFYLNAPPWVRIYLAEHHCPHKDDATALYRLAAHWGIANQHQRAARVGITWPIGGFQAYDDFGSTMLGRWVTGLGVRIAPENAEVICAALEILCLVSLSLYARTSKSDGAATNA